MRKRCQDVAYQSMTAFWGTTSSPQAGNLVEVGDCKANGDVHCRPEVNGQEMKGGFKGRKSEKRVREERKK